jgi:hypothetical protein
MKKHKWLDAFETGEERARLEAKIPKLKEPSQADVDSYVNDRRILAVGAIAKRLANPSGMTFEQKIKACANSPDNDATDEMMKALSAIESTLASIAAAKVPIPPKKTGPARAARLRRRTAVRPLDRTCLTAKPSTASISAPGPCRRSSALVPAGTWTMAGTWLPVSPSMISGTGSPATFAPDTSRGILTRSSCTQPTTTDWAPVTLRNGRSGSSPPSA